MSSDRHYVALRNAVDSGLGFHSAAETEACARWALDELDRYRAALERIAANDPYAGGGGAWCVEQAKAALDA